MGEADACGREAIDGEDYGLEDWQEDREEDLFSVSGQMEGTPNRRCQLGK